MAELNSVGSCSPFGPSRRSVSAMAFRYDPRLADGDDAGSFDTSTSDWRVGDTLIADDNQRYRVTAVLAPERLAKFLDGVESGVLEVEPLELLLRVKSARESALPVQ
jgi:hypothetical protein